jgi:putative protease
MAGKKIGKVVHYYDKIGVAIIDLNDTLRLGDQVTFKKGAEETPATIESIQIERTDVDTAKKGDVVGVKVDEPLKEGTEVFA